ncbi:MAG: S9 family peptidase, partial [Betaproteobacteria bacterium]|nr:S9 family peptidase [Betaproteobacteria bacterium]
MNSQVFDNNRQAQYSWRMVLQLVPLIVVLLGGCTSLAIDADAGRSRLHRDPLGSSSATLSEQLGIPAPLPAVEQRDLYWGVSVNDPFRFLEQPSDPRVAAWTKQQALASERILEAIQGRSMIEQRLKSLTESMGVSASTPKRSANGRWFYTRRLAKENQASLVWRESQDKPEVLLVDSQALSKARGKPIAIQGFWPSDDGERLAYAIQEAGSEIGSLHVIDVASKRPLIEPIDRIRFASLTWDRSGEGFFFSRLKKDDGKAKASERFLDTALHYFSFQQTDPERVIFKASTFRAETLPLYSSGYIREIPQTDLLALIIVRGVDRRLTAYLAPKSDVLANRARWQALVKLDDDIRALSFGFGHAWAISARDAPTQKLVAMPIDERGLSAGASDRLPAASWKTVLPASDTVLRAIDISKDAIYLTRRRGVNTELLRAVPDVRESDSGPRLALEMIKTPREGSIAIDASDDATGLLLSLSTWTHPMQRYWYHPESSRFELIQMGAPGRLKVPPEIIAREVMYASHDGVMVPMSILLRSDLPLDANRPTILYGYGAYGITQEPGFSASALAWVERGGLYAIAHVRGGGNFGSAWHEAGKKTTKFNTWKDGIAAAQWLIDQGYTKASRLGIYGGSAGGMFVGRAITERPDLFVAAVPSVAMLDMLRSEQRANGAAQIPEYGTVADEKEFHALLRNSSYHAIEDGRSYPAVMLFHGVNDTRVDVWQSTKFASRLAQAQAGQQVVMLRLDYQSGHGSGSSLSQSIRRSSDLFSFLLWQMKEPGFELS